MRTRGTLAAVAATVLLVTAGCGSANDVAGGDGSSSKGSATKVVPLSSDTFVQSVTAAQVKAKSTHIEMKIDAAGQAITARGDVAVGKTAADSKMAMKMSLGSMGDLELRLVDKVLYLNMGTVTGDKFSKVNLDDPNSPLGRSFGGLTTQLDPSKSLESLDGAITSFQKAGAPVSIDGVKAQPYTVVVDTAKLKSQLGGLAGEASGAMPKSFTYTYWVGPDNLPRKIATQPTAGASVEATFTKWGDPVSISAPTPDQITQKSPFDSMPSGTPTA